MLDPTIASIHGVRGLLLDLDGVLVLRGKPIPGARAALARLDEAGFPYAVATNMSIISRATLAREFAAAGFSVPEDRIVIASWTAAAYAKRRFPDGPLYVLASPDGLTEFDGQNLLSHEEAAGPSARAAAVIVGDAGDEFTAANVQSAFRLIREGAAFVAMHRNRWWLTPAGARLDSGAYVAALEFGTQKRAVVTGKPSPAFFREGLRRLGELAGGGVSRAVALRPAEVAMVGDDLWNDVRGAQRAGLRGIFVRSGKHGEDDLRRLAAERHGRLPDADLPGIAEVVEAVLR
jgi:HAD superfamily hydrolase (TIGR01458 family)